MRSSLYCHNNPRGVLRFEAYLKRLQKEREDTEMEAKKRWDVCPSVKGYARKWEYGFFERVHGLSMNATQPFPADEYTFVETELAIYRFKKSEFDHPQIVEFLLSVRL